MTPKQEIISKIKWEREPIQTGGQTVTTRASDITLVSEATGITIKINWYKSTIKNKDLAQTLFELALDEILK